MTEREFCVWLLGVYDGRDGGDVAARVLDIIEAKLREVLTKPAPCHAPAPDVLQFPLRLRTDSGSD